jgi:hypothetical protein
MTEASLQRLCAAVSAERMMADLAEFARWIKLSGTADELNSLRHVRAELDAAGFATTLLSHDAYISLPGAARLEVGLVGAWTPHAITHSFSRPSPEGGLTAEIVYVKSGGPADIADPRVRGRILLVDGIASPAVSLRASEAGAAGQIHISPHADPHEMCISPVWGSPTDEALARLPRTVVLSIGAADGAGLKQRIADGQRIQATLHAEVDTRWRETPVLVADLAVDGEAPFVLFSGHHDTWYYGVMDNGSANATMLEVARLLAPDRAAFRRGLRICFWSGHSHGRYAGSTWYADNHWDELNRRCVAHVNVDSTGGLGASVLADVPVSAELRPLGREAVLAQGGQRLEGGRMSRAGDESFWGIGLPSMYMCMGEQPADGQVSAMAGVIGNASKKSAGLGWWWHTPHDTMDKIDPDNLVRDTRVYVHTLWRLLTDAVLPLDYGETAADLGAELRALAGALGGRFDLAPLLARAEVLAAAAGQLGGDPARVNAALMAAGRALVPLDYTTGDRFSHDPALGQSPWPVLDKLRALAAAAPGSEAAKFLTVAARRACNRLAFALDQAIAALSAAA